MSKIKHESFSLILLLLYGQQLNDVHEIDTRLLGVLAALERLDYASIQEIIDV